MNSELQDRRRALVTALRSGQYGKNDMGYLAVRREVEESEKVSNTVTYCCIGVACSLVREPDVRAIELDRYHQYGYGSSFEAGGYSVFMNEYDADVILVRYLASMNDGNWSPTPVIGTTFQEQERWRRIAWKNNRYMHNRPERSFEFIARFLEIVWGV